MLEIYEDKQGAGKKQPIRLKFHNINDFTVRASLVDADGDDLDSEVVLDFIEDNGKIKLELAQCVNAYFVHVDKAGYIQVEYD